MMRTLVVAICVAGALVGEEHVYLFLLKAASALAYVSPDGKVLTSVPVGQHPHEMVFSPDGRYLYTTDNGTMRIEHPGKGGNSVSIIDVRARKKIGDISLGDFYRPHGIDYNRATNQLVVTTELPDQLLVVDPNARKVVRTFPTKGKTSHMVTLGPKGATAYVSNSSSGNVSAINLATGKVKLIETGKRPEGSILSRDGRELYVVHRDSDNIAVIDTSKDEVVANVITCKGPVRIALTGDGKTLVYACMLDKKVGFADPATRKETGYALLPNAPVSLTLSHDGQHAFASAEEQDRVYMLSVAQRKIVKEIVAPKGSGPDPVHDVILQ